VLLQDDFVTLAIPRQGDRSKLDAALSADSARERARILRRKLVQLLAGLGLPLWLIAGWPGAFSPDLRGFFLAAFAACLGAVVLAVGWEWRWQRARSWRIAELGPRPRLRSRDACAGGLEEES